MSSPDRLIQSLKREFELTTLGKECAAPITSLLARRIACEYGTLRLLSLPFSQEVRKLKTAGLLGFSSREKLIPSGPVLRGAGSQWIRVRRVTPSSPSSPSTKQSGAISGSRYLPQ